MMRDGMPGALPEHEREHCPEQTTQRNATQLTHVSKTQDENPQVLNAANPVENEVWRVIDANEIAWTVIDVARKTIGPDFFVTLDFRYGIADELQRKGFHRDELPQAVASSLPAPEEVAS